MKVVNEDSLLKDLEEGEIKGEIQQKMDTSFNDPFIEEPEIHKSNSLE